VHAGGEPGSPHDSRYNHSRKSRRSSFAKAGWQPDCHHFGLAIIIVFARHQTEPAVLPSHIRAALTDQARHGAPERRWRRAVRSRVCEYYRLNQARLSNSLINTDTHAGERDRTCVLSWWGLDRCLRIAANFGPNLPRRGISGVFGFQVSLMGEYCAGHHRPQRALIHWRPIPSTSNSMGLKLTTGQLFFLAGWVC